MAGTTIEVESKFEVHGLFTLPDLAEGAPLGASVRVEPPLTLRATYFDSQM